LAPAINAFLPGAPDRFVICVDSPEWTARHLCARRIASAGWFRARAAAEPDCDQPQPVQVLAMEIDYGRFERVLDCHTEVDPERVSASTAMACFGFT